MPSTLFDLIELVGFLLRAIGFLLLGYALGRFMLDAYRNGVWQVQIALVLGLVILLIGLTHYASPGSSGAFALGAGLALLRDTMPRSSAGEGKS